MDWEEPICLENSYIVFAFNSKLDIPNRQFAPGNEMRSAGITGPFNCNRHTEGERKNIHLLSNPSLQICQQHPAKASIFKTGSN